MSVPPSPSPATTPSSGPGANLSPVVPLYTKFELEKRVRASELKKCVGNAQYNLSPSECACTLSGALDLRLCVQGYEEGHKKFTEQPDHPFGTLEWCVSQANGKTLANPEDKTSWLNGCMNGVRK
jgi:hypothetical protein